MKTDSLSASKKYEMIFNTKVDTIKSVQCGINSTNSYLESVELWN